MPDDATQLRQDELTRCSIQRFSALKEVYGDATLENSVAEWMKAQLARCADPGFAALFTGHVSLPGVGADDYLHKLVPVRGGFLLGGIRFYGQDINRPFVEIMAWTGSCDWPAWAVAVSRTWRMFSPNQGRILHAGGPDLPIGELDQTVHAGRMSTIASLPAYPGLSLEACGDPAFAAARVAEWYRVFTAEQPDIAAEIHPADEAELAACLKQGSLHMIRLDGEMIGLIATESGAIDFFPGHVVIEEVLAAPFRGRGLGKFAQIGLARELIKQGSHGLMIGTIHRLNAASRKTAIAAARPAVLSYRFLPLPR